MNKWRRGAGESKGLLSVMWVEAGLTKLAIYSHASASENNCRRKWNELCAGGRGEIGENRHEGDRE